MAGVRRDAGLIAGVTGVGDSRIPSQLVEESRVETVRPPILQALPSFLAHRERNALLAHLARRADSVAKLVDEDRIAVGRQCFFVAFQRAILEDAVAGQLHAQTDGDLVASALARLILDLDERVRALAHELGEPRSLQSFLKELLRPKLDCQCVIDAITGRCHLKIPRVRVKG